MCCTALCRSLVVAIALGSVADAAVIVSVETKPLFPSIQTLNVIATATAGEAISSMDLDVVINGGIAGGPGLFDIELTSPGTVFSQAPASVFPEITVPTDIEVFYSIENNVIVDVPIGTNSILAVLHFNLTGLPPAYYPVSVHFANSPSGLSTALFSTTGEIFPTFIDGGFVAIPEPTSIVLAAVSLVGLVALCRCKRA
jgi:hypothetical protein